VWLCSSLNGGLLKLKVNPLFNANEKNTYKHCPMTLGQLGKIEVKNSSSLCWSPTTVYYDCHIISLLWNLTNYARWHFKLFTTCHVSWDTLHTNLLTINELCIQSMVSSIWLMCWCLSGFIFTTSGSYAYDVFGFPWTCILQAVILCIPVSIFN